MDARSLPGDRWRAASCSRDAGPSASAMTLMWCPRARRARWVRYRRTRSSASATGAGPFGVWPSSCRTSRMGEPEDLNATIARLRGSHDDRPLSELDVDPDPLIQFGRWMSEAIAAGIELPNAMALATADAAGAPSARMVLLKGVDADGF